MLGDDGLDGFQAKLESLKAEEDKKAAAAGEFDALKQRLVGEHTKATTRLKGELEGKIGELSSQLEKSAAQVRKLLVSSAFASSPWRNENLTLGAGAAERLYGSAFKVEERDGEPVVVAYKGVEPLLDAEGNPLSFDAALREIVEADPDHKGFLKAKAKPGAGSKIASPMGDLGISTGDAERVRGAARIAKSMGK
jgi:hypothetical protein